MKSISLDALSQHIEQRLDTLPNREPGYTLVLGSGFSHPLIPTAREMVGGDLAWWLFCQKTPAAKFSDARPKGSAELTTFEADLWRKLHDASNNGFDLDGDLPNLKNGTNVSSAYQALMSGEFGVGLSTPGLRRSYFRDIVRRVG